MTKEIGVGKAHSKIILMGEHSVVYGYPAISLPLNRIEVTCQVFPSERAWTLYAEDTLSMAVFACLEHLGRQGAKIRCQVESMVPEKRGMGSSAAVSIAAIRAVFDYFEEELDDQTLEILANRAEMIAHMNPSGLDAKTCLSDVAIKFIRNFGFSEIELDLDAFFSHCRYWHSRSYPRSYPCCRKSGSKGSALASGIREFNEKSLRKPFLSRT